MLCAHNVGGFEIKPHSYKSLAAVCRKVTFNITNRKQAAWWKTRISGGAIKNEIFQCERRAV